MDKDTRTAIERATQEARELLVEDFRLQLEGEFDVHSDGTVARVAGAHLKRKPREALKRDRIVATIEHKRAAGMNAAEAVADYLRDAAFTTLNRFVALKMLEAREIVPQCITKGDQSAGYREFTHDTGTSRNGIALLPDSDGYQLYLECLFDELSTEVKVLFDRRDPASALWPKRPTFAALLGILNAPELADAWGGDETIGWVYQFFNDGDERRAMRDASQAPRNSRDLAVRNQFFTPRFVVQFLTDNTLARAWYEMRNGETALRARCEYLPPTIETNGTYRERKDPRDLRVLDPACGSGHFLLYAFDLLLVIYEEAYRDTEGPTSVVSGRTLAQDYPDPDAFRRAVPALILAHNLHGVDIDPRCVQIAQLALWMRAQRAFQDAEIGRGERPPIRRSNIVIAEPIPADDVLRRAFVTRLGDTALAKHFEKVVEAMTLAGDLGLLLPLEELVHQAWTKGRTGNLFAPQERQIRSAIQQFAEEAATQQRTARRLFADDTLSALGLIELAEQRFDVVLMNPPFGSCVGATRPIMSSYYSDASTDILAAFVQRGVQLLAPNGLLGAITSRTGFFNESLADWRKNQLAKQKLRLLADLGEDVLDGAMVEVAAYVISNVPNQGPTTFLRAVSAIDKAQCILDGLHDEDSPSRFVVDTDHFLRLPLAPFAYWVPSDVVDSAAAGQKLEPAWADVRSGLQTNDDPRFVRLRWEVSPDDIHSASGAERAWVAILKSDSAQPWLSEIETVVKWHASGRELKALVEHKGNSVTRHVPNEGFYFRPGVSWVKRATRCIPTIVPAGAIPTVSRYVAYPAAGREGAFLGMLASDIASSLLRWNAEKFVWPIWGTRLVKNLWMPAISVELASKLSVLASQKVNLVRQVRQEEETSCWFVALTSGSESPTGPDDLAEAALGVDLEQEVAKAYGFSPTQVSKVVCDLYEALGYRSRKRSATREDEEPAAGEAIERIHRELSYALGAWWGRWNVVTNGAGEDANADVWVLPTRPPGAATTPSPEHAVGAAYPVSTRSAGTAHDDPGGRDDLANALATTVAALADRKNAGGWRADMYSVPDIRSYMAERFFDVHIKHYTACRRKAPIYWQLATPTASYSVWLYLHALTPDTLYSVQREYVVPKMELEERKLESLRREFGDTPKVAERKLIASQAKFVGELRGFVDELKRVAPLFRPCLDDGVVINFAMLWRLVPHHKAWQKELRATWSALCAGDLDWAQLAMRLWPERVVPKCATDRSLAVAHGLEEVFWVEGVDGKWKPRRPPLRSAEEVVRERSSTATRAALESLLDAPTASTTSRRGRASPAATEGGRR